MRPDREICTDLMDRAARGDGEAFGSLALAVQDDLYRFGLSQCLRQADAAEATQECFLRAYRQRATWRPGGDVMGWMYGIAMNVVREFRRRNRRLMSGGLELDLLSEADCDRPGAIGSDHEPFERPNGDDFRMQRDELAAALAALPPRQQEAVACRYLMEMSLTQTAQIMGCAEGTIKAAVFAGLANLRKLMRQGKR